MSRKRNKGFNLIVFLLVLLSIIFSIPKYVWANAFFASLILIELSIIMILGCFWIQRYIIKISNICTEMNIIDEMKGTDFEVYVRDLYIKLGYKAYTTPNNDFGADVIASKDSVKYCIQAKRYNIKYNIGITAVQEVIGSINFYKANKGIVITNSNFTSGAIKLADANNITLINRNKLQSLISTASLSTNHKLSKFIKFINES